MTYELRDGVRRGWVLWLEGELRNGRDCVGLVGRLTLGAMMGLSADSSERRDMLKDLWDV